MLSRQRTRKTFRLLSLSRARSKARLSQAASKYCCCAARLDFSSTSVLCCNSDRSADQAPRCVGSSPGLLRAQNRPHDAVLGVEESKKQTSPYPPMNRCEVASTLMPSQDERKGPTDPVFIDFRCPEGRNIDVYVLLARVE